MKNLVIFMLVVISLIVLTSCVVVVDRGYYYENSQNYKSGGFSIPSSYRIDEIDISWLNGNVVIESVPGDSVIVRENPTSTLKEEKLHYLISGNKLYIKYCTSGFTAISYNENKTLYVSLPKMKFNSAAKITITSTNASVSISNTYFSDLNIKSNSGNISLDDILLDNNLSVSTQSGQVNLKNSTVKKNTVLSTVSGKIAIEILRGENLDIESNSGSVELELSNVDPLNSLKINSTSSSIVIRDSIFNNGSIKTKSGSSKLISSSFESFNYESDSAPLTLKGIPSFKLYFDTSSGSLSSPASYYSDGRGLYIYPASSNPTTTIRATTRSGNIYFEPWWETDSKPMALAVRGWKL